MIKCKDAIGKTGCGQRVGGRGHSGDDERDLEWVREAVRICSITSALLLAGLIHHKAW